jgi:uncharacterized protein YgfB (UPF0149 family)
MSDYSRLEQLLNEAGFEYGPSEVHGMITGLICAGSRQVHEDWIESQFEHWPADDLLVQEAREMLEQLYFATREQIGHEEMPFMPFLPNDSQSLSERVKQLSEWCEGYLYGLGLAGVTQTQLVGDAREALQDLTHFTHIDYAELESGEATEMAYMELQEFLKVVTMLMWETFAENRRDQDAVE